MVQVHRGGPDTIYRDDEVEMGAWRLLKSGCAPGAVNMAIDEALALEAERNGARATLRLFSWCPAAISLGHNQDRRDIDVERCRRDGIDVVRRPTGGRAILHSEEVTYSVSIPAGDRGFRKEISSAYELISRALIAGLNGMGVGAAFERAEGDAAPYTRGEFSIPCFSSSVRHEVVWRGRKLVGSAQRRYEGAVLQHGSILLGDDHLRLVEYLAGVDEAVRQKYRDYLRGHTVTVSEIAGRRVGFAEVAESIVRGFEEAFEVHIVEGRLSAAEHRRLDSLLPKYEDGTRCAQGNIFQ